MSSPEMRVLDATKACTERWGLAKVTIDDVARESGVSRATIYRLFPGGKDVIFDALREREQHEFFSKIRDAVRELDNLEDILVTAVVVSTMELRADDDLAMMLSTSPGETVDRLTVEGLPQIINNANAALSPLLARYVPQRQATAMVDVLVRLSLSYFLAPSAAVDLGDEASARKFLRPFITVLAPAPI